MIFKLFPLCKVFSQLIRRPACIRKLQLESLKYKQVWRDRAPEGGEKTPTPYTQFCGPSSKKHPYSLISIFQRQSDHFKLQLLSTKMFKFFFRLLLSVFSAAKYYLSLKCSTNGYSLCSKTCHIKGFFFFRASLSVVINLYV